MSIEIKPLAKPVFEKVKMGCDRVIDKRLMEYPMCADAFSTSHFSVICAPMGYGKTSLVVSYLKTIWRKCYDWIYVVIHESSRRSIDNDLFGKELPEDQMYSELTEGILDELIEKLEENTKNDEFSLIVIDDMQSTFKDPMVAVKLQKLVLKLRHLRTTIVLLQQSFTALPKILRKVVFNWVLFNLSKSELEDIFEQTIKLKRQTFDKLIKMCFQDKHDYILLNTRTNRIFKGFDEIIITE